MARNTSELALVFAPLGRDAAVAASMLHEAKIEAQSSRDLPALVAQLKEGAGFAVVTEEAVERADLRDLTAFLKSQPEWSDFPFILLTRGGGGLERNPSAARFLDTLGNVAFLERPFHPTTLISLAQAALRGRRRQYEARAKLLALRHSEEELRLALSAGKLGSWSLEIDGRRLTASPRCKANFGRAADADFTYDDLLASIHGDDRDAVLRAVETSLEGSGDYDVEYRCIWPDKSVHWVAVRGEPVYTAAARPLRMTGVSQEITERKQVEEAILESERQFRTLADSIPTLCWIAEPDGNLVWYNERWYAYTGTKAEDMKGWGWQSVHVPRTLPQVLHEWRRSLRSGRPFEMVFPLKGADGVFKSFLTRIVPVRDKDGKIVRWFGTNTDISQQQKVEAALRDLAVELDRRVEERTLEREEALQKLHEMSKLETIGQLTGGVAHDFNNLLMPILGGLELLRRRHTDERSQKTIANALQAAERSRTLISRLLSFARRQHLEARPVDIADLVRGMMDLIRRSIGPQIVIDLLMEDGFATAIVDPNQFELALLNLAVNSRDAMPEGGQLSIAISAERVNRASGELKPGDYIRIAITDTGVGMDNVTLLRAVEPFYSTKGVGKGTGLGLSMVHGLAAQSGGVLRLKSKPGKGTTAELWLPAAEKVEMTAKETVEKASSRGLPLSVLLVDDEELVRFGTAEMLADLGHSVTQAASGAAATALLRKQMFDLLITDYLMPRMNGLELIEEANAIHPALPALVITGFANLAQGCDKDTVFLAKPFRQAELGQAILEATGRERFSMPPSLPNSAAALRQG